MARGLFEYDPETREFRRPDQERLAGLPAVGGADLADDAAGSFGLGRDGGDAQSRRVRRRRKRRHHDRHREETPEVDVPPFRGGKWQAVMWLFVVLMLGLWVTMIVLMTRSGDRKPSRDFEFGDGNPATAPAESGTSDLLEPETSGPEP